MCKINARVVKLGLKKYFGCEVILENIPQRFIIFDADGKNIYLISKDHVDVPRYVDFFDYQALLDFIQSKMSWQQFKCNCVYDALGAPSVSQFMSPYKKLRKEPDGIKSDYFLGFWTSTSYKNSKSLVFVANNGYMNITEKINARVAFRPFITLKKEAYLVKNNKGEFIVKI